MPNIMRHWWQVELDLHEVFGIDVGDRAMLRARSWRWMRHRLVGLLSTESRIQRVLNPTPEQKKALKQAQQTR